MSCINISDVFKTILLTSAMGSIIVGVIVAIKILLKNRVSAAWHYYIWLLLIVRLIMPYAPKSSLSIFNLFTPAAEKVQAVQSQYTVTEPAIKTAAITQSNDTQPSYTQSSEVDSKVMPSKQGIRFNYNTLAIIWLTGAAAMLLYVLFVNIVILLKVNRQPECRNSEIIKIYKECKADLNLRSNIPIIYSKDVETPSILGFIRPKLLVPPVIVDNLQTAEKKYIFLHELIHLKRKDVIINWITIALLILYWFNPIIWFAFYRMQQDCEVACDAAVLSYLNPSEYRKYGETIINMLDMYSKSRRVLGIAGMAGSKSNIKRRIKMIANFKKKSYIWSAAAIFAFVLIGVIVLTNSKGYANNTVPNSNATNSNLATPSVVSNTKHLTKEGLQNLMGNSIDYFNSAVGSFEINDNSAAYIVEYKVRERSNPASYVVEESTDGKINRTTVLYDGITDIYNESNKTRIESRAAIMDDSKVSREVKDRLKKNSDGINEAGYRYDPAFAGIADNSLFPQGSILGFLEDYSKWNITGSDKYLGFDTYTIEGTFNNYYSQKFKAVKFKWWVEKNTGILLKEEWYNKSNQVVESMVTQSLKLNVTINDKEFIKDKSGYKLQPLFGQDSGPIETGTIGAKNNIN